MRLVAAEAALAAERARADKLAGDYERLVAAYKQVQLELKILRKGIFVYPLRGPRTSGITPQPPEWPRDAGSTGPAQRIHVVDAAPNLLQVLHWMPWTRVVESVMREVAGSR